jgi:hypothetical protein
VVPSARRHHCQQLAGAFNVTRVGGLRAVAKHRRRDRGVAGPGSALEQVVHNRFNIDRVVDSLANAHIIKRLFGDIEEDVDGAQAGGFDDFDIGVGARRAASAGGMRTATSTVPASISTMRAPSSFTTRKTTVSMAGHHPNSWGCG